MRRWIHAVAAIAAASLLATSASAGKGSGASTMSSTPSLASCGAGDITAPSVTMITCTGFDSGNLLNAANATRDQQILNALPYSSDWSWDGSFKDATASVGNLNGTHTLDFGITLTGITVIAVHYGGGQGSPGGQSTAFYVLDAAQGVKQLHLSYNASSNAVLFVTGLPQHIAGVPEPATWATMIAGFGMVGVQMRRRKRASAAI